MANCSILLIIDDYKERLEISNSLENQGFKIDTAGSETSAFEKLKSESYDLLVVDYNSSQINTLRIFEYVKEIKEDIKFVIIADDCNAEAAVQYMKDGAFDFLMKPLSKGTLESIIARVIAGKKETQEKKQNKLYQKYKIVTNNKQLIKLLELAKRIANSKAPVLIQGESGTGKELFARYIHQHSPRTNKNLVALNCAALPDGLLESELFGHEKGAFTGAITRKIGKFELANESSILLDEISEMNLYLQAKLLRVLQESEIDRVGGINPVPIDVRVIATTNRDLDISIKENKFRSDLFYRLNVIPIKILSLRERKDDIAVLSKYFIKKYNKIDKRNVKGITNEALEVLISMPWPGNVRELENIIERSLLLCDGNMIEKKDIFVGEEHKIPVTKPDTFEPPAGTIREMERKMIFHTLEKTNGNRTHAADLLGISVRTLRNKLNEYRQTMEVP